MPVPDPARRRAAVTATIASFTILLVIGVGLMARDSASWTAGEMNLLRQINLAHVPAGDWIALTINGVFSPLPAALIALAIGAVILLKTRHPQTAVRFISLVAVPWLGTEVIKLVVHRERPDIPSLAHPLVLEPGGLSFPSGHTAFVASLLLALVVLARGRRGWPALVVVSAIGIVATAASRVYLGVHYPTDVIASIVYTVAAVALVNTLFERFVVPHWSHRGLATARTTV